jgi:CRISPR-associated protein Csc2
MIENIREYVYSKFGENCFAKNEDGIPALAQNKRRVITLYVLRETIGPMIDRSDDPESTITLVMQLDSGIEKEIVEVPARKFKSKEKLMGLKLCRMFNVISPQYEYNNVGEISYLGNPNSAIFGDSVVKGGDAGQAMLPTRVFYSSSYSIRSRADITKQLTHNSLSEAGTMWDRDSGKNRTSLFNTEYILPGVFFPSFITVKNPTPETLIHLILSLSERSYGAQTSITGPNIKNNVVGIYCGEEELPITSYTISRDLQPKIAFDMTNEKLKEMINEHVLNAMAREERGKLVTKDDLNNFLDWTNHLSSSELSEVYNSLKEDATELIKYANILNPEKSEKKNKTKKQDKKEEKSESDETSEEL